MCVGGAQEEEFQLRRGTGRMRAVKKETCTGDGAVHVWRGVCKGVNKVRRAVARTTTNPELGLVPSQHPTHPSFAPSVFFPASLCRTA